MQHNYEQLQGFLDPEWDRSRLVGYDNRMLTAALFVDVDKNHESRYEPVWCMSDTEVNGLPSAYHVYMNSADEYEAAMKLVGSLRHWRRLLEAPWFMNGGTGYEGLHQWREDMMLRDFSVAKGVVLSEAKSGDPVSAKKLLDLTLKAGGSGNAAGGSAPGAMTPEEQALSEAHGRFVNGG